MKFCKVDGCEGKHMAKGYCNRHYQQIRDYGKILKRTRYDPNEIIIKGDIAEIVLYNVKHEEKARTTIDAEDVEKIKNHKWHLGGHGYVNTKIGGVSVAISNFIMGCKCIIDHRNLNTLNNRKSNLRRCTKSQNAINSKTRKTNTSGYKGLSWDKKNKKWKTRIMVNGKEVWLGRVETKLEAARKYNRAAVRYFGSYARLNEV